MKAQLNEYKQAYCAHCNKKTKPACVIICCGNKAIINKMLCIRHFNIALDYMLYGLNNYDRLKKEESADKSAPAPPKT